jgi:hypothetical protein
MTWYNVRVLSQNKLLPGLKFNLNILLPLQSSIKNQPSSYSPISASTPSDACSHNDIFGPICHGDPVQSSAHIPPTNWIAATSTAKKTVKAETMSMPLFPHQVLTYLSRHSTIARRSRITSTKRLLPLLRHSTQHPHNPLIVLLVALRMVLRRAIDGRNSGSRSRWVPLGTEKLSAVEDGKGFEGFAV